MGKLCVDASRIADQAMLSKAYAYEGEMHAAITQAFGAKHGNKEHDRLYNLFVEFLIENGELSMWESDPNIVMDGYTEFLDERFKRPIRPQTIILGRTATAVYNISRKIIADVKKEHKVTWWERGMHPLVATASALRSDRYGIIKKLFSSMTKLVDSSRQRQAKYVASFDAVRSGVTRNIESAILNGTVTLNDIVDGIEGLYDRDGNELKLVGVTKDKYKVIYDDDETGTTVAIRKQDLMRSTKELNNDLISLYRDQIWNELVHGEMRHLVPQALTKKIPDYDWKKLSQIMERVRLLEPGDRESEIHSIRRAGKVFKYVMIKQPEGMRGENYHVYITRMKNPDGSAINYIGVGRDGKAYIQRTNSMEELGLQDALKQGYYKAQLHENFGRIYNKKNQPIPGSVRKEFSNFRYLDKQPSEYIMDITPGAEIENINYKSLWDQVMITRRIWRSVAEDIIKRARQERKQLDKWLGMLKSELEKQGIEGTEEILADMANLADIGSQVWIDRNGNVNTPNSTFLKKAINYGPVMFRDYTYRKFLDEVIDEINTNLEDPSRDYSVEEESKMRETLENLELYRKYLAGLVDREDTETMKAITLAQRSIYTKHRLEFTDYKRRRKDGEVHLEYLDKVYNTLERNDLTLDLVKQLYQITKFNKGKPYLGSQIDWIVNRAKISLGDPNYKARFGPVDVSNTKAADMLNKAAKIVGMTTRWDAESAEKFMLKINGLISARFLGMWSALGNRTQLVNVGIALGFKNTLEGMRAWNDRASNFWQAVVDNTGVLNLISMFNDVMLSRGEVTWKQAGLISHPIIGVATGGITQTIPGPGMKDFLKVVKMGRENFIKHGERRTDQLLKEIYKAPKGKEAAELGDLRQYYFDLMTLNKEGNSTEVIEAYLKGMLGDVKEAQFKKMVAWKLTWFFDEIGGKNLGKWFTFTGGETELRAITVVVALMVAGKLGILGDLTKMKTRQYTDAKGNIRSAQVPEALLSQEAVNIARRAVYSTQFGMNQAFLGEMFGGMGKVGMQYKSYMIQQILTDWNTFKNFTEGSRGTGDSIARLLNAQSDVLKRGYKSVRKKEVGTGIEYDITSAELDHDALAVIRLVSSRMLASIIAGMVEVVPMISYIARMGLGTRGLGPMRSMENPLVGVMVRTILWGMVMGFDWEDDEMPEPIEDWMRFVLPPAISIIIQYLYNQKELIE
mgnify:FL=1